MAATHSASARTQGNIRTTAAPTPYAWWTLAATCIGLFMALLDVTVVNVALPTIQRSFSTSFGDLQWVINAYTLALAVFLVTVGRLGDIFGRKLVFMIGLSVFTLGSMLCGLSNNLSIGSLSHIQVLWAARAIQGLGGSVMIPLSLAIISATFQGKQRGAAIGIWGACSGLSTALGPLVGGLLVEKVSWESIFFVNIPIGVVGLAITARAVRESRDERAPRAIDLFGLLTLTLSLFCLVLGLIQANDPDKGWTSGYILTLFAVAAVALAAFVVGELRLKHPMVDPRLFKNASFTGAAIAGFSLSAGLYALFFFLALYFQNALGFSALSTGVRFLPLSGLVMLGAPLAGALGDRLGARTFLVAGLALIAAAVLLMTRISPHDGQSDWLVLLPAFILAGIGNGFVNPPISEVTIGTVSRARAGMASGVNGLCRQVGTLFGIAFPGAVLTSRYNTYIHDRVMSMAVPPSLAHSITPAVRQSIATNIQHAGTIAGSLSLKGDPAHPNPYAHSPLAPTLASIARASFVDGLVDIFKIAAVILAVATLAALLLVKRSDMIHENAGAASWEGAHGQAQGAAGQPNQIPTFAAK